MYERFNDRNVAYFDVDDTLVILNRSEHLDSEPWFPSRAYEIKR